MNDKPTKVARIVVLSVVAAIVIAIIGFVCFLYFDDGLPDGAIEVTDGRYEKYADIETVRKILMCPDFLPYKVDKVYEYPDENGGKVIMIQCLFSPELPDSAIYDLICKFKGGEFQDHCDGGWWYFRGWTKKEYMQIPDGMEEEMCFQFSLGENKWFTLYYYKNPSQGVVAKDSLNNCLGIKLPPFKVTSSISTRGTVVQFTKPITKEAYHLIEEKLDYAVEEGESPNCYTYRSEDGTEIEFNVKENTATLRKYGRSAM